MCMSSPSPPPPPPERQAMQSPKDDANRFAGLSAKRRRGMWASIFTSPQGVNGMPTVTGNTGGVTGG